MIRSLVLYSATFLLAAVSGAQVAPQPAPVPPSTPATAAANQLASGTVMAVELARSIDARKIKANDKIEAKTVMDMLSHGQIVIPRNTKIIGHVTEAKAHSKQSPDSMVGITFDHVLMKDGRELPLQASVQAVARPLQTASTINPQDPMNGSPGDLPTAGTGQRGSMGGSSNTSPTYPTGYPPHAAAGSPSDPVTQVGSTVAPLGSTSQGVVGIKGLSLNSSGSTSVLSSNTDNVHLETGAQLILRVQ